jgi:WD40 repeat protein
MSSSLKSIGPTTPDGSMSVVAGVSSSSIASGSAVVATASTAASVVTADTTSNATLTDQAVLEYLNARGMSNAVMELKEILKTVNKNNEKPDDLDKNKNSNKAESQLTPAGATPTTERLAELREQLETDDEAGRGQRTYLSKATGGGFGYDLDAAAPVAQWGVPDKPLLDDDNEKDPAKQQRRKLGVAEAKSYLDAFCALQLWILSLPEDSHYNNSGWQPLTENVVAKAHALLLQHGNDKKNNISGSNDTSSTPDKTESNSPTVGDDEKSDKAVEENRESDPSQKQEAVLTNVISELIRPAAPLDNSAAYPIPLSAKPELLSVCFALLVHTYCELLEVGMETTAHVLRDAFKPVYDPIYGEQYKDLYHCNTTEDIVKLNTHNSQHMEALQNLRNILLQIAQYQAKSDELSSNNYTNPAHKEAQAKKLQEYSQTMGLLQQRHNEMSQRASAAFERMHDLPFLRRARAVRWQITMSNTSYGMLCQFLSNTGAGADDTSMLAMSTLLQTKCEMHIERRDPLPFTPAVVLDDNGTASMSTSSRDKYRYLNKDMPVQWAAPSAKASNKDEPFPKFYLEQEYNDERTARHEKRAVEFNRNILVNGFRRLEALERKRDYEVMSKSRDKNGTEATTSSRDDHKESDIKGIKAANPLEPSILLSTLCANHVRKRESTSKSTCKSSTRRGSSGALLTDRGSSSKVGSSDMTHFSDFTWEESGIGITCAKLCQPDGRKVAIGCDDAGIRVWNLLEDLPKGTGNTQSVAGDAGQVLLGHKNGFPVFDVSWNRDGRCLLSAGGDGSIRLWDTDAQGSFGEVVSSSSIKCSTGAVKGTLPSISTTKKGTISSAAAKDALVKASANLENAKRCPDMSVPGLRSETRPYKSGAALAVYRGHAPNTPIWSVVFAPCGYYFASAGSDATARLWVTDRPVPVRIFTGHTSNSVHSVAFHPNCNYILTGSEDKTVRLWDIQTGRCVRLLNGCPAGVHRVDIDPSGQYAVGADVLGTVHLWDLATGKKVTELRGPKPPISANPAGLVRQPVCMLHSLAFSACGRALATGGDDRCVRIWDIRKETVDPSPVLVNSHKSFGTRRTMILDLQYTKRNLLLGVGKFISGIPAINTIAT